MQLYSFVLTITLTFLEQDIYEEQYPFGLIPSLQIPTKSLLPKITHNKLLSLWHIVINAFPWTLNKLYQNGGPAGSILAENYTVGIYLIDTLFELKLNRSVTVTVIEIRHIGYFAI